MMYLSHTCNDCRYVLLSLSALWLIDSVHVMLLQVHAPLTARHATAAAALLGNVHITHLTSPHLTSFQLTSFRLNLVHCDWSQPRRTGSLHGARPVLRGCEPTTSHTVQMERGLLRWLLTFNLSQSMDVIFALLPTGHWLFHGRVPPVLVTEASMSRDPACGTVYQLICVRRLVMDSLGDILNHI